MRSFTKKERALDSILRFVHQKTSIETNCLVLHFPINSQEYLNKVKGIFVSYFFFLFFCNQIKTIFVQLGLQIYIQCERSRQTTSDGNFGNRAHHPNMRCKKIELSRVQLHGVRTQLFQNSLSLNQVKIFKFKLEQSTLMKLVHAGFFFSNFNRSPRLLRTCLTLVARRVYIWIIDP